MKQAMINYMQKERFDDIYTPKYAVYPLLKYLPSPPLTVWECCDAGDSNITKILQENGYNVISTDIKTGLDFLRDKPDFEFDLIVTNPPYSLKDVFIRRCYELQKPFALLLPITALEGVKRGEMYRKNGISIIVLDKRVNFINYTKRGCWFNTSWFL